jgi:predicted signal transduction protein with EAL and GGDEF domain
VTASIGIAPLLADRPIAASIERADRAMYSAKRAGRNRVRLWQPEYDDLPHAAKPLLENDNDGNGEAAGSAGRTFAGEFPNG